MVVALANVAGKGTIVVVARTKTEKLVVLVEVWSPFSSNDHHDPFESGPTLSTIRCVLPSDA